MVWVTRWITILQVLPVIVGLSLILWQKYYVDGLIATSSFNNSMIFTRELLTLNVTEAYKRCLKVFRDDNMGLPTWMTRSVIIARGDESTGLGCIIRRAPLTLQEGIVEYNVNETTKSITMQYKVLNPSYSTFPVISHLATVSLLSKSKGCTLIWTIDWIPLPPTRFINLYVANSVRFVINRAADYVLEGDYERSTCTV